MKRLAIVISLFLCLGFAVAQDEAQSSQEEVIENPVEVRVEIFLVSQVQGEEQLRPATSARPGQTVEYRITAVNRSPDTLPQGSVEILGPIPDQTTYVPNSATPMSDRILLEFSADGGQTFSEPPVLAGSEDDRRVVEPQGYDSIRWTLLVAMEPGQEEIFFYRVTVDD